MMELKLRSVGNSVGTTIPKTLLDRLRVDQGDTLYVQERDDGSLVLSAHNPETVAQIEAMRVIMDRDREILQALV